MLGPVGTGKFKEVYTDGSGPGKKQGHLPRFAQKAGAAAVAFRLNEKQELVDVEVMVSSVPGAQTVPRAELHSYNFSSKLSRQCKADASYVVNGTAAMYEAWWKMTKEPPLTKGTNADLWSMAQKKIRSDEQEPARKVTSHTTASQSVQNAGTIPT